MTELRQARLSELAWVKALLESQLVAVDYPDLIPRIKARMKAIENGQGTIDAKGTHSD